MATKSTRVSELEEGIAEAVAALDEADGSRIGMQEAFDSARETLSEAYGAGFENAVSECLSDSENSYEESEEFEEV